MKELIRDECLLELCPPGIHRQNIAEVEIKSFKKHFLSVLSGLPDDFPWSFWDLAAVKLNAYSIGVCTYAWQL